jgi:DNA-binding MarR family transcriptional regulator
MAQDHKKFLGTPIDHATRLMFTKVLSELVRSSKDLELSLAQVALVHLLYVDGSKRVLEVAEELALSPSAASRMVDAMAERDLVHREEDPSDRRARVLTLTTKGRALADRLNEARLKTFATHIPLIPQKMANLVLGSFLKLRKGDKSAWPPLSE